MAAASGYYCFPFLGSVPSALHDTSLPASLSTALTFSVITLSSSLILLRRVLTCCNFLPFSCCALQDSCGRLQHDALTLQPTNKANHQPEPPRLG